jgi:hypothetical protein
MIDLNHKLNKMASMLLKILIKLLLPLICQMLWTVAMMQRMQLILKFKRRHQMCLVYMVHFLEACYSLWVIQIIVIS